MAVSYNDARPTVALQVQIPDEVCLCSAVDKNYSLSLQHGAGTSDTQTLARINTPNPAPRMLDH